MALAFAHPLLNTLKILKSIGYSNLILKEISIL